MANNKKDFIDKIREHNSKWYGDCVLQDEGPEWGDIFTEKMYSDRTHFIYELLQNAEDACERKRPLIGKKKFSILFKLTRNGLEIKHNGIDFDENDIERICQVGKKKKENVFQIGKFGIGFKSVYAYTKTPYIYSGGTGFHIRNLVLPHSEEMIKNCKKGETLFILPFNHKEITPEKAYEEIGARLQDLGLRTLLFLRNIDEIIWEINGESGKYSRTCENKDGYRRVTLNQNEIKEEWLIFEKSIPEDELGRVIEVAYLIDKDENKIKRIIKAKDSKLVAYFPTKIETHLNFLIQGPYNTTATRENIEADNWNEMLISRTADLIAKTISQIKSLKLLDVNFLNILPLNTEHFMEKSNIFKPLYERVKEKL